MSCIYSRVSFVVLQGRLELVTGATAGSMSLEVFDVEDRPVCHLTNDEALLGSYPVEENYRIHVSISVLYLAFMIDVNVSFCFHRSELLYTVEENIIVYYLVSGVKFYIIVMYEFVIYDSIRCNDN